MAGTAPSLLNPNRTRCASIHTQTTQSPRLASDKRGILLDIHGQGSKRDTVFRGTKNGLTVSNLRDRFGESAHTGPKSLFGLLQSRGWTVYPANLTGDVPNTKEQSGFTGGYIVQTYGSHKSCPVDAIQLEFGTDYRAESQRSQTAKVLADALAEYATTYLKMKVVLIP